MHVRNAPRSSVMDSNTRMMVLRDAYQEGNEWIVDPRIFVQEHLASEYVDLPVTPALKCDYSHTNTAFLTSWGRMESRFAAIFINHLVGGIRLTAKVPLPGRGLSHRYLYLRATCCDLHSGSGPNYGALAYSATHAEAVTMSSQWSG